MVRCLNGGDFKNKDIYNNKNNKIYLLGGQGDDKTNIINRLLGNDFTKRKNKRTGIFSNILKINENFIVLKTF